MSEVAVEERNLQSEPDEARLRDIVAEALAIALRRGADQAEAAASHNLGLSATARLGDVENLEYTNDRGVGVTVYRGSRKGSASTSDFSPAALAEAVDKALSFAKHTAPDDCAGLADAELMAGDDTPDLDLYHRWPLAAERAIELAIACEESARSFDERITNSEGASVSTGGGSRAYGNSHGFLRSISKTSHSISCTVVGSDDDGMQRDYWYSVARDTADLESVEAVGQRAAKRTVERLGARKIPTRTAPVVFAPELARGFIGHAVSAISGGAQYRRSSFLLDALGEEIFPPFVTIRERPHLPKAMASAAWDGDGVATRERDIVADGILQSYLLSAYSARRLGLQTTGNAGGAHNLVVDGNREGLEAILAEMGEGLLVLELIGQGVNGVTGDYSRGAAGFWIEDGVPAYPVEEITIAGNLRDLYRRIVAIGRDQDLRGGIRCGSLMIESMRIAGN
ncbi:MAG: metalloprotease PmbA [Woeseiaceae bacterium]|nr:metalloprotease PmbA [Woeseiaceae bacterium]